MDSFVNLRTGDNTKYNGKHAVVVSNSLMSDKITLKLDDGTIVAADKNDIFGINSDKNKQNCYLQERIDDCDEQIAKNKNIIEKAKEKWNLAQKAIKEYRTKMYAILREFHASSAKEITNSQKRKDYSNLSAMKYNAVASRNRATSDIIGAAIDTGSACSAKIGLIHQQALAEHLA